MIIAKKEVVWPPPPPEETDIIEGSYENNKIDPNSQVFYTNLF